MSKTPFVTKEQFEIFTDKRLFKDFCIKHNVDVIPDYTEEDVKNNKEIDIKNFLFLSNSSHSYT